MPLPLLLCWAALAAVCLGLAGCGRSTPYAAPESNQQAGIPRPLAAPSDARPLASTLTLQAPSQPASERTRPAGSRIVELSVIPEELARKTIRQPGAVAIREPASPAVGAPVREPTAVRAIEPAPAAIATSRSPYVASTVPDAAQLPDAAPLPHLPPEPNFDVAAAVPPSGQGGPYEIVSALPARGQGQFVPPQPQVAPAPAREFTPPPATPPALPSRSDSIQAATAQAQAISDRGLAMAQRGMLFAGREETIKALQLIAQALDVQSGGNSHCAALAAGLTALDEARDFAGQQPLAMVDVAAVARSHRTPLLKQEAFGGLSPVVAQQQYLGFAQSQLALAAGSQPAASQVLYRLGRLHTALAAQDAGPQALHAPQAIVFHQAALAIDAGNYLAANELGVLLARYGQLERARELLIQSVARRPQVESLHNLAIVHRRLGETEQAQQAERQRAALAGKSSGNRPPAALVQWVDTRTFASAGGGDVPWPENRPGSTAAASTTGKRR